MNENKKEIKAIENRIKDFFGLDGKFVKKYRIPTYQRDYKWDTEHVSTLLEDINLRQEDGKEHYFGMIATSIETNEKNISENIIKIMDGQQRIVTSFLILHSLYELSKKKLEQINKNKNIDDFSNEVELKIILEEIVYSLRSISNFRLDFEISSSFAKSFQRLIDGKPIASGSNLYINLEVIKKFLEKLEVKKFLSFKNTFVNFFMGNINYKSTTVDEEIIIFENINAKGVALNDFEMISNYLISLPDQYGATWEKLGTIRLKATKLINQYIKSVPQNFSNRNKTKITRKQCDDWLMKFLETYLKYKMAKSNVDIRKEKRYKYQSFSSYGLYKNFKNYFKHKKGISINEYESIIHEMSAFLDLYLSFRTGKGVIKDNIWLASYTEKNNHFSVLFAIFDKFAFYQNESSTNRGIEWKNTNSKEIKLFSKSIVEYHLKHLSVVKKGISLSIFWDNVLQGFVKKNGIQNHKELRDFLRKDISFSTPTNNEFRESLLRGDSTTPKYLKALIKILNYYGEKGNEVQEKIVSTPRTTFEHVFPQKPTINEWPKFSQDSEVYTPYIHMIGNIVLVNTNVSAQLRTQGFLNKKEVFANSFSPLVRGESFGLDHIGDENFWGPKVIERRTDKLISILIEEIFDGDFI